MGLKTGWVRVDMDFDNGAELNTHVMNIRGFGCMFRHTTFGGQGRQDVRTRLEKVQGVYHMGGCEFVPIHQFEGEEQADDN